MATSDSLVSFDAVEYFPALSAALSATLVSKNDTPYLSYDASQTEAGDWRGMLPDHYAGGGIDVEVWWRADTGTTSNSRFDGQFEARDAANLDTDADSFAAIQSASGAAPSTLGQLQKTVISFTNAQIDGLLKNEGFRFRLFRDHDHADDAMAGDCLIDSLHFREA